MNKKTHTKTRSKWNTKKKYVYKTKHNNNHTSTQNENKEREKRKKNTINRKYGGHTLRLVTGNRWKLNQDTTKKNHFKIQPDMGEYLQRI